MADIINNGVPTPAMIYGRAPNGQLQAVTTDGLGNISFAGSGGTPGGLNTQVQYNNAGAFGGNAGLTFNAGTTTLAIGPTIGTGVLQIGNNGGTISSIFSSTLLSANGAFSATGYQTATNCSSSGGTCGSAAAGSVTIAAAATTVIVATTAVTANSQILLTRDDSLGTKLSVTCNTATIMGEMKISARTPGTSFTITVQTAPVTNPGCFSYSIIN